MAGFMTGFAGRLSDIIRDKKEYIRERVDERRDYLRQQGLQRKAEVMEARRGLKAASELLISRGMDEGRVASLLQESPTTLTNLARQAQNNPSIGGTKLNTVLEVRDSYDPALSIEDYIEKVTPVFTELPDDATPEQVEGFSISRLLGLDAESALQSEVYSGSILGTTGANIEASLAQPIYRGTGPGQYDFTGLTDLSAQDISLVATQAEQIINNQVFTSIQSRIEEIQNVARDRALTDEEAEEQRKLKNSLELGGASAIQTAVDFGLMSDTTQNQLAELYSDAPRAFRPFGDQSWIDRYILGQEPKEESTAEIGEPVVETEEPSVEVEPVVETEEPSVDVGVQDYADDDAAEILGVPKVDTSSPANRDWTIAKQRGQIAAKIDSVRRSIVSGDFGPVELSYEIPLVGNVVEYFKGPPSEGSKERAAAWSWIDSNTDKLIKLFQNSPEAFEAFEKDPMTFVRNYVEQLEDN